MQRNQALERLPIGWRGAHLKGGTQMSEGQGDNLPTHENRSAEDKEVGNENHNRNSR